MSHIKISATAQADIQRLYDFLSQYDTAIADNALDVILKEIEAIKENPSSGSPLFERPEVRKLVVRFGSSGYLIFHKRYIAQDISLITRIIHQKEWYDAGTIGKPEEGTI